MSLLFNRFIGSEKGFEQSKLKDGYLPPSPPNPPTAVGIEDNEDPFYGMYMKVRRGEFVGWERIN